MATISRLSVSLSANTTKLRAGLKKGRTAVERFSNKILSLKGAIAGALGAASLGALAKSSVSAFETQEQAVAKLNASIKSMGRNTKNLNTDLQALASQIQNEGIIGDEAIIEGQSFLTTYADITDKLLPRTTRIMADLAAKMGGDTTRAANLLGKASMGLVGSLSIAGISLSEATKESKDFEAILTEIEAQVGGTNKALGDTTTGGIKQFTNAVGDIKEKLGEVIAIGISPFLRKIGLDLGAVSFDAKKAGGQFRQSVLNMAHSMTPLADAIAGIQVAWKTLKLATAGFGLFLVTVAKGWVDIFHSLGDVIGLNLVDNSTLQMFDDMMSSQMETVKNLKAELSDFTNDVIQQPPSLKFKAEIDKFAFESELNEMKRRIGFNPDGNFATSPAAPQGVLQRLEIGTKNPQIDQTNALLQVIGNKLGQNQIAVAG